MLYTYFGTDTINVRKNAHNRIARLEKDAAEVVRIAPENWSQSLIEDALGSSSLFGETQIFLIDTPSEDAEMFEYVMDTISALSESGNIFVLIEASLLAAQKKKLEKYSVEFEERSSAKVERFNVFMLAEQLARHDKRSLWISYQSALRGGLSAEEIIGTLFWQIKMLRLAANTSSADEAGQKSFVYGKAKSALAKFKEGELDRLSTGLIEVYHDGHGGKRETSGALEQWILSL